MALQVSNPSFWLRVLSIAAFCFALILTPRPPLSGSSKDAIFFVAVLPIVLESVAAAKPGMRVSRFLRDTLDNILGALQSAYSALSLWALYQWNLTPANNMYEPYIGLLAALIVSIGVFRRSVKMRRSANAVTSS